MSMRFHLAICLSTIAVVFATSPGKTEEVSQDHSKCIEESAGQTAAMLECDAIELKKQDSELNDRYRSLTQMLDARLKTKLRDAQRNWLATRRSTCELTALMEGGGTLSTVLESSCFLDETKRRSEFLGRLMEMGENEPD